MDESQPVSPRSRMQALMAIPERERTDAEWEELNELELMLAPGNRLGAPQPDARRDGVPPGGRPNQGRGSHSKNRGKNFHRRPPKGNAP